MPRLPRHKSPHATFYHLLNRVAGDPRFFPFDQPAVAHQFLLLFEFYLRLYFCRLASLQLMGNHYHAVVYFEAYRKLDRRQLQARARRRFGRRWQRKTQRWNASRWEQFNRDLFDVSRLMQHVNGEFAKWFNRRWGRRGHFWADRYKNPELLDRQAVQDTILYTELNAVRAGLVQRPEDDWRGSAYWRWAGQKTDLLIPLQELFAADSGQDAFTTYRAWLDHCGALAPRDHQTSNPEGAVRPQPGRSFARRGVFGRRRRCFTEGVALGGRQPVQAVLRQYREKGWYRRRRYPIPQLGGRLFSLREQRSHGWSPG